MDHLKDPRMLKVLQILDNAMKEITEQAQRDVEELDRAKEALLKLLQKITAMESGGNLRVLGGRFRLLPVEIPSRSADSGYLTLNTRLRLCHSSAKDGVIEDA